MTQFKVINRETKEVQIFNTEEILTFFRCEYDPQTKKVKYYNNMRDYAISEVKSKIPTIVDTVIKSVIAVAIVVLTTELILKWF